jgi:hypothetical protein
MAYAKYERAVQDAAGNLVTGVYAEVRRESDNALAALYTGPSGGALANPAGPFGDGKVKFYTPGSIGGLKVRVYGPGVDVTYRNETSGNLAYLDDDVLSSIVALSPDVIIDDVAGLAAHDGEAAGFVALVADNGDERSAYYIMGSGGSGDWSDPIWLSGPAGPAGVAGQGLAIKGSVANTGALPGGAATGDVYHVVADNHLYLRSGGVWVDIGEAGAYIPYISATTGNPASLDFREAGANGTHRGRLRVPASLGADRDYTLPDANMTISTYMAGVFGSADAAAARTALNVLARASTQTGFRGAFAAPAWPGADNTPAEISALIGSSAGYYHLVGSSGSIVQFPPGFPQSHGQVTGFLDASNNYAYSWQELTGPSGNRKWMRRAINANTWTAWAEIYHTGNILGTVSQASGVPTGSIIQRGSNANGAFVRYADGTQICTFTNATGSPTSTSWGGGYLSSLATFTFPSSFVAVPDVAPCCRWVAGDGFGSIALAFNQSATTTSVSQYAYSPVSTGGTRLGYVAVGRWF